MLRNRLHTFYDREGLHPILAPPYHTPAFRSLERGLRLKSCKYCFVVQIFNYDLSVLWLAPLSHRCYFLLFRETGRHNLTGDPNNTLWVMSPAVLENPKCTEKRWSDVFPWDPYGDQLAKYKIFTLARSIRVHKSARILTAHAASISSYTVECRVRNTLQDPIPFNEGRN